MNNLQKENKLLKKRLSLARDFIIKEISSSKHSINLEKKSYVKNIKDTIFSYFGDDLLFSSNSLFLEHLIGAEISFYSLSKLDFIDGSSVLISYQKALDLLIEKNITSIYRSFVKKKNIFLNKNDLLEKNLASIVQKSYKLGFTRLFSIIQKIKNNGDFFDYGLSFLDFLNQYKYIKDIILSDDFYILAKSISDSGFLGEKRHIGKINFSELRKARFILVGDFKEKNSLIYKLLEIGKIDF